jgi:hypothetical protein
MNCPALADQIPRNAEVYQKLDDERQEMKSGLPEQDWKRIGLDSFGHPA